MIDFKLYMREVLYSQARELLFLNQIEPTRQNIENAMIHIQIEKLGWEFDKEEKNIFYYKLKKDIINKLSWSEDIYTLEHNPTINIFNVIHIYIDAFSGDKTTNIKGTDSIEGLKELTEQIK